LTEKHHPPTWRVAAVVASDVRFVYFGSAAFATRVPMNPRRIANVLNTKPELLREFCGHLVKPGDETAVLFADGKPVEIPMF
jgi:hypothetical protein